DKGKYAWARSKLTEASLQWVRESKQDNASRLKRLRAFDRSTLSGADLANYDTVEFQMETIARTEPFEYGDGVRPYVASQLTGAAHEAGVGHLPQGEALYQVALRQGTTTALSADEVHRLGLGQAKELDARMNTLLRAQGKKSGTVSERMHGLARDPRYLYPDTDTGRQQILDYCNGLITALQPHLPKYFHIRPKMAVEIRRVPAYTEAGAPGGYYQIPALDASRPGAFYINLRDTSEWSRWKLPTLVYHESEPGHHFQLALVLEMPSLPLIRKAG